MPLTLLPIGIVVGNAALAFIAWWLRAVRPSGAAAGFVVGGAVAVGLGARGYALLLLALVLAVGATRIGFGRKRAAGIAEASGGARGGWQVLANGGPPAVFALCAGLSWQLPGGPMLATVAFAGALATLAADTVSSEVGKLVGGPTRRLPDFAPVAPGTPGGVSVAGSLAGLAAAGLIALAATTLLLPPVLFFAVAAAGFIAALFEGFLSPFERSGRLTNDAVNAVSVLVGGWLAAAGGWLFTGG